MSDTSSRWLAISRATHRAVTEFTGSDGVGHCQLYAAAGVALATWTWQNRQFVMQAGRLAVFPDPDDPQAAMEMNPAHGLANEVHVWIASMPKGVVGGAFYDRGELVDLSARHYKAYFEPGRLRQVPGTLAFPKWNRPEPPEYWRVELPCNERVGGDGRWVMLVPDAHLTTAVDAATVRLPGLRDLLKLARRHAGPAAA